MNPFFSNDLNGLRVLLADDEIFIRQMCRDVLAMLGCIPTVASDGWQAWELFREDPAYFDVIISDYNMPEMNGIDLAAKVLSLRDNMPFIMSTGLGSGFNDQKARDLGISCTLPKPYVIKQLEMAIIEAIRKTTAA